MLKKRITTTVGPDIILCKIATYVQRTSSFGTSYVFDQGISHKHNWGHQRAHLTATSIRNDLKSPGTIHSTSCRLKSICVKTTRLTVHRARNAQWLSANTYINKISILTDTDPPPNSLHIHCIILCTRHLNNPPHSSHFNNYDNY